MSNNNSIHSFSDIYHYKHDKILVLYSGGVDGTYLLLKMHKQGFKNVIALSVDVGGNIDYELISKNVYKLGYELMVIDKKKYFAEEYIKKAIFSKALYFNSYPISASLSRPLTAELAVNVCQELNINIIVHTSNNSQNSMRRFNNSFNLLKYSGVYGSPYEYSAISRSIKLEELKKNNFFVNFSTYSSDVNLWCREFESGEFDNPENIIIPEGMYVWTKISQNLDPCSIAIEFQKGVPISVNEQQMNLIDIIEYLNKKLGVYGIGRYVGLEEIQNGKKVLEIREAPAACILIDAFRHLETAILPNDCIFNKMHMEQLWIQECSEGRWFGQLKAASELFITSLAENISGKVSYKIDYFLMQLTRIYALEPIYVTDRNLLDGNEGAAQI